MLERADKNRLEEAEEGEVLDSEENAKIHFPVSGIVLIGVLIVCIAICWIVIASLS